MDILRKLRGLESTLTRTVDAAAHKLTTAEPREPLEILHAIVESVEKRIEPAGRGRYVFPFNQIGICIAAGSTETRARFEAVLGCEPSIQDRIVHTLQAAGCEPAGLSITTTYVEQADALWSANFNVEFVRMAVFHHSLKLTIVQGFTEKPNYVFATPRINLGRCPEVRDNQNRLIRTNHVAFVECAEELNRSVSRHHAHIDQTTTGEYRLCDDRSVHGTSVQRNGVTISVPPGPRGIRLQCGDEVTLGEARLHIEILPRGLYDPI